MHYIQVHQSPDVYKIMVPVMNTHLLDGTNCYVIKDGDDCLVIDTGAPSEEGAAYLRAALDELQVDCSKASFFLTHFHFDHAGLLDTIVPPEATVYAGPVDFRLNCALSSEVVYSVQLDRLLAEGVSREEALEFQPLRMSHGVCDPGKHTFSFVGEGDIIQVGGYAFEVLDTAGHTRGHLSLYHRESSILFSGDHILFFISPSIELFPGVTDALLEYFNNLKKVKALKLKRLFMSHGEERSDFVQRINWLISHHENRLRETYEIIQGEEGLAGEEVIRKIRWNVPCTWDETPLIQRWCIYGEGMVILDHLVQKRAVVRQKDELGKSTYYLAQLPG